jgi:TP901 family phage tail tape measure protein
MAQLRIKIGAAADQRSFDVVFGSIEKRGKLAAAKLTKDWAKLFGAMRAEATKAGAQIERALSGRGGRRASAAEIARPTVDGAKQATAAIRQELRNRLRAENATEREIHREKLRNIRQQEREKIRASRNAGRSERSESRDLRRFANRTSHRTTRFLSDNAPLTQTAMRFAGGVARGAGVDMSFGGGISRNVEMETQLTDAINSARFAGTDLNIDDVQKQVRSASNKLGMSREETTGGVLAFQKKTGDLGLGFEIMEGLAEIGVATGTKFDDMADAAGDVANILGDIPDKGKTVIDVFKTMAGQGARGAVEISDLASGMAKLAAAAGRFEGDRGTSLKRMGALAQLARATGGAASANEATTAVARFTDQLGTPARLKQLEKAGVQVRSKTEAGQFADPFEIIKSALVATKGDPAKMAELFSSSVGRKPVQALSEKFLSAGGAKDSKAGLAAIDAMIAEQMEGAELGEENIQRALDDAMKSTARQVQLLNNEWDDAVHEMQEQLVPALQSATPHIIAFGKTVGEVAVWAVDNPKRAIAAGIGLSIARAGIESTLRTAIDKTIMAAGPPMQAAFVSGIGQAFSGMTGLTLAIGTAYLHVQSLLEDEKAGQDKRIQDDVELYGQMKQWERKKEAGTLTDAEKTQMQAALAALDQRINTQKAREEQGWWGTTQADFFNTSISSILGDDVAGALGFYSSEAVGGAQVDKELIDQIKADREKIAGLLSGDLKVRVINADEFYKPEGGGGGSGIGYALPVPGP